MKTSAQVLVGLLLSWTMVEGAQAQDGDTPPDTVPMTEPSSEPLASPSSTSTTTSGGSTTAASTSGGSDDGGSAPATASRRPEGRGVGIGAGFVFPADVTMPSVVSVRFRLGGRFTFEPAVVLGGSSQSDETDVAVGTDREDTTSELDLQLSTVVRFRMATRGPLDFVLIGAPGLSYTSTTTDPDGADNATKVSSTSLGIGWGIGIEWFLRPHWSLSFDALNPLFSIASTTTDRPMMLSDTTRTTTTYGAVFDPTVRLMGHLFF